MRRHSSQPTIVRSKTAPSQLATSPTDGSSNAAPMTGVPVRDASHVVIGSPLNNQSALSLASPAIT